MKNKWKIIIPALIVLVLAAAFVLGDRTPAGEKPDAGTMQTQQPETAAPAEPLPDSLDPEPETPAEPAQSEPDTAEPSEEESSKPDAPSEPSEEASAETTDTPDGALEEAPEGYEWRDGMLVNVETGKDKYQTDSVPEGKPLPVEPEDVTVGDGEYTCTLSISCATILDNLELCDPEKVELVPEDGWILEPMTVTFYEGESVFNVLQRTCKQQKIHMEFTNTPVYNSAYIEGIGNLYEFDVGNLSGWMYKVNGWFPNYGCSRYQLKDGDVIESIPATSATMWAAATQQGANEK